MKQYIDFFQSQRKLIDRKCSPLLNEVRDKAFLSFEEKGFPQYGSEDYQHTNIDQLLETDYGFYLAYAGEEIDPYQVFKCNLTTLSSHLHFMINGYFYRKDSTPKLPDGVFSGSLNEFAERHPDLFKRYYGSLAGKEGDSLTAFNTMFVQDGYVLYVPKNTRIDHPIQLTNVFNGKADTLINRRILIILEEGAEAKVLVCDHCMDEQVKRAATQVSEIYVGKQAIFDFYELEESSDNSVRLADCFVQQEEGSSAVLNTLSLSNGVTRNNYRINLDGERADTSLCGLAILDQKQQVDNYTLINHNTPHCTSNELFKYILDDQAVGAFSGKINVREDSQKTQAYQNNRNLLAGNDCRMFSKPQLEIYADDVKCSHGMTTGQLDENALFYLRSRGISEAEARILLRFAFADDVIQSIRLESLRERLRLLVEKRFRGEPMKCQGCH